MAHVTPGYMEIMRSWLWFYEEYNQKYIRILKKYHAVILGQFFGHHHTDTFRIVEDEVTRDVVSEKHFDVQVIVADYSSTT